MDPATLTPELRAVAPESGRRLGAILLSLAALIARAFLRDPRRVGLIVPLWTRLTRAARRFERLMARIAAGTDRPRPYRARAHARAHVRSGPGPAALPSGHAWLIAPLRHEAVAHASHLRLLLSDPATAAIVAASPQAARILRPLCRMLGVNQPARPKRPKPAAPRATLAAGSSQVDAKGRGPIPPGASPPAPAPCAHVGWPWFPGRLSGRAARPPPDRPAGFNRLAHGFL